MNNTPGRKLSILIILLCASLHCSSSAFAQDLASTTINAIWNDVSSTCKNGTWTAMRECGTQHDYVIMANGQYLTTTGSDNPMELRRSFSACARWKFIRSTDVQIMGTTPYTHLIYQDKASGCGSDLFLQVLPDTKAVSASDAMPLLELLNMGTDQWQIMKKGTNTIVTRNPVDCPNTFDQIQCKTRHTMLGIPADYALGPCCVQVTYQQETLQTYLTLSGSTASNTQGNSVSWAVRQVQPSISVQEQVGPNE